jgi:hypothetical protein
MQGTVRTVRQEACTLRIVRLAEPANEPLVRLGPARTQQLRQGLGLRAALGGGGEGGGEGGEDVGGLR